MVDTRGLFPELWPPRDARPIRPPPTERTRLMTYIRNNLQAVTSGNAAAT